MKWCVLLRNGRLITEKLVLSRAFFFFFWSIFKIKYELQNVQQKQHNKNLIKWRFEIESDATAVVSGSSCYSHFRRPTICTCYSITVSAGFSLACNEGQRTG